MRAAQFTEYNCLQETAQPKLRRLSILQIVVSADIRYNLAQMSPASKAAGSIHVFKFGL